jgi:hypothetical protein
LPPRNFSCIDCVLLVFNFVLDLFLNFEDLFCDSFVAFQEGIGIECYGNFKLARRHNILEVSY